MGGWKEGEMDLELGISDPITPRNGSIMNLSLSRARARSLAPSLTLTLSLSLARARRDGGVMYYDASQRDPETTKQRRY